MFLLIVGIVSCLSSIAQINVSEPDFEGEVLAILNDSSAVLLEKVMHRLK